MSKNRVAFASAVLAVVMVGVTMAAVPPTIAYQGRLTASDGTPFTGNKLVRFNIYDGGGSQVWSSGFVTVNFQDGLFAVKLGELPQPELSLKCFAESGATLGITVDTDPELAPRTAFTTQPYAYQATVAQMAETAQLADSVPAGSIGAGEVDNSEVQLRIEESCPAGQFIRAIDEFGNVTCGSALSISYSAGPGISIVGSVISLNSSGCSSGEVLKWNGLGWDCVAETGDISAVTAGSGLAGGATSGEAIIWIPDEGVSYTKIDTGAVGTSEILDLTITNSDISNSAAISASKISGTAATLSGTNTFAGSSTFSNSATFSSTATFSNTTRVSGAGASLRVGDSTFYANSTGVRMGDPSSYTGAVLTIERNVNLDDPYYAQANSIVNTGTGYIGGLYLSATGGSGYAVGLHARAVSDGPERRAVIGIAEAATDGLTTGSSIGVKGVSWDGNYSYGVYGDALAGTYRYGVYGKASAILNSYAGYFIGNAHVTGTLSKGAGSFKIDHPLDPENKYLQHSFVESPDMMNVYNGNVVTDGNGEATVTLPDYFEALNKDFRYQLTVIGEFAQAIVAQEIASNRFVIRTDKPNIKVSWQVTGVRQDPYANANRIEVEVTKTGDEVGKYAHPEAWGKSESQGVDYEQSRAAAESLNTDDRQ